MLYFDYNATAPLLPCAKQAWLQAVDQWPGNPSSLHRPGTRASHALESARNQIASLLHCDPDLILWTSGATEAINTVFHHSAHALPSDIPVWISSVEHPAVTECARHYFGSRVQLIPVTPDGVVDWHRWLESPAGRLKPGLVAVMAANNETGVIQPWQEVQSWCHGSDIPFFCDAVQWLGRLPASGLGSCDWVSASAHKWGGPRGMGFLKCPEKVRVEPLIRGGPQEEGRRAGTENVAGALAMTAALRHASEYFTQNEESYRMKLRAMFEQELIRRVPGTRILGHQANRLWNTVSVLLPGDCRARWLVKLDKRGCAVSTGSACSSGKAEPSKALLAMGCTAEEADRVIRFSSGWETTVADWSDLVRHLEAVSAALAGE